jgi:hypothetical protein
MEILRPSALFSLMAAFGADPVVGQLGMLSSEAQTAISVPCCSFVFRRQYSVPVRNILSVRGPERVSHSSLFVYCTQV